MDFPYNIILGIQNQKADRSQRVTYKSASQAATKPVTLSEAKLHLKMDDISADDDLINALIASATEHAQNYTNRVFINTEIVQVYDAFPTSGEVLRLAVSPLVSVGSVVYLDANGDSQTWDDANYVVDIYTEPSLIVEKNGSTYPDTIDQRNAVTVTYTSGFGTTAADVPQPIKQAILLLIGHFYNHREDTVSEKRTAAERLLNFYRVSRN
jgi:uncharacterized phiE125 gp8 family phage protein